MNRQQFEHEMIRIALNLIESITDAQLLYDDDVLTAEDICSLMIPEESPETNKVWDWETRGGLINAIEDGYWERMEKFYQRYPEQRPQEIIDQQLGRLFAQLEKELK